MASPSTAVSKPLVLKGPDSGSLTENFWEGGLLVRAFYIITAKEEDQQILRCVSPLSTLAATPNFRTPTNPKP